MWRATAVGCKGVVYLRICLCRCEIILRSRRYYGQGDYSML
jgi:hypothetical protein